MKKAPLRWVWLLVCSALAACATTLPSGSKSYDDDEGEVVSFEAACADESSLLALCDGHHCGMYPCREVVQSLTTGKVVPALAEVEPFAEVGGGAQRHWGSAQDAPWDSRPVFIIPWNNPKPLLLPSQQKALEEAAKERNKPHEKHHIFSREFVLWFEQKKINIDEYTIPLELMKHRSIHRGERGGPWNAAWRAWIPNHTNATREEIFRYAGQLIYEFQLFDPVMPYWKTLPQPLPPGYSGP